MYLGTFRSLGYTCTRPNLNETSALCKKHFGLTDFFVLRKNSSDMSSSTEWYYADCNEEQQGPCTSMELKGLYNKGVNDDTLMWMEDGQKHNYKNCFGEK